MGERAGYRLIAPDWPKLGEMSGTVRASAIYRMQWFLGNDPEALQQVTLALVNRLTRNAGEKVGSGSGALRGDLMYDRLWPNFIIALSTLRDSPFHSVHDTVNCDISDHGLFTLRVLHWSEWVWEWNAIKANWESDDLATIANEESPIRLMKTTFIENRSIVDGGMAFEVSAPGFKEAFGFTSESSTR